MIWLDAVALVLLVIYVWMWSVIIDFVLLYKIPISALVLPRGAIMCPALCLIWIIWRITS